MHCSNCNEENVSSAKFCKKCGAGLLQKQNQSNQNEFQAKTSQGKNNNLTEKRKKYIGIGAGVISILALLALGLEIYVKSNHQKDESQPSATKTEQQENRSISTDAVETIASQPIAQDSAAGVEIEKIREKVNKFVKNNSSPGTEITIKNIIREADLYKVTINAGKQEIISYVTLDGNKLFSQVIDLNSINSTSPNNAKAEKNVPDRKVDLPVVDLFVMSYCPYAMQMEKGLLPVIDLLGDKVKFNLKFVSYTLHGQKEVVENVNQYCIQKNQPAKLVGYLKCFWKDSAGKSNACMQENDINTAQIATCVAETNKQFTPTEKAFDINKDENIKFGVQGSPVLLINGATISSGRDSASILKAICGGFVNQPTECGQTLSTTVYPEGFSN